MHAAQLNAPRRSWHGASKAGWPFFGGWNSKRSVHYKLRVPADVTLDKINTVNSAITVTGVHGPVNLDTVNGSSHVDQPIKLSKSGRHGLAGEIGTGGPQISLETVNGSIAVRER